MPITMEFKFYAIRSNYEKIIYIFNLHYYAYNFTLLFISSFTANEKKDKDKLSRKKLE